MTVRPAHVADVPAMASLIKIHADQGKMVPRGQDELYAQLPSYFVAEHRGQLLGCASVYVFWEDLAEIKGLAVATSSQGQGVGRELVLACHEKLKALGVARAFALTSSPRFFERLGYRKVAKESLPHFIWGECVRCPSFPACNEDAMVFRIQGE